MDTNSLILEKVNKKNLIIIKEILKKNNLPYQDIETNDIELFLAYEDSSFVGIAGIEKFNDTALLRSMVINKSYRQQGYGKKLCQKLFDYSKERGIKEVYLLTCTAKEFFEHLGFKSLNRLDVPEIIKNTTEFSQLCPDSAICLKIEI